MTPHPPDDVDWLEDGFAIELGRLRRGIVDDRNRHVWALTAPLYLFALGIELSVAGSAFVDEGRARDRQLDAQGEEIERGRQRPHVPVPIVDDAATEPTELDGEPVLEPVDVVRRVRRHAPTRRSTRPRRSVPSSSVGAPASTAR
ncbi:MAG: hypothetical protein AAF211_11480 [Myxococcota bacterium]